MKELGNALNRNTGNRLADERTRLNPASPLSPAEVMITYCGRLSPEARKFFTAGIATLEKARGRGDSAEEKIPEKEQTSALDSHYASEVIEKLDAIVDRALRLERLPVGSAPNEAVQRYFQEAHDCYLYGFDTGCVALCRAILESALEDLIPLRERDGKSVMGMVHVAKQRGLLTAERASWAEQVYSAGNLAIHRYQKFEKQYSREKLEELFWKARAVVEDLYKG